MSLPTQISERESHSDVTSVGTPLGVFETVHVPNEDYGEVDHKFLYKFNCMFGKKWKLVDDSGNVHDILFNGDFSHPLMIDGWEKLKSFYDMSSFTKLELLYFGNDVFQIKIGHVIHSTDDIPSFHSRSTAPGITKYFDFILEGNGSLLDPYLVLPEDFADYVVENNFDYIVLSGKKGQKIDGEITMDDESDPMVYIEHGWPEFCEDNEFEVGDHIRFKFASHSYSRMANVYKITM